MTRPAEAPRRVGDNQEGRGYTGQDPLYFPAGRAGAVDSRVRNIGDKPRVSLTRSAALSISNNTATDITWDVAAYNVDGMWDTAANPTRVTARTAGIYLFVAEAAWVNAAGGNYREGYFLLNAANPRIGYSAPLFNATIITGTVCIGQIALAKGDYVVFRVLQDSGAALSLTSDGGNRVLARLTATLLSYT